jgi:quinol monooxygenase YgiN
MKKPVFFTVSLGIREGRRPAFESTAREMVAGTSQEPGALAYDFYVSANGTQCRLLEGYVDSDAAAAHLTGPVVTNLVPKLLESATLESFEVYGDPGPQASQILTNLGAKFFGNFHGYRR